MKKLRIMLRILSLAVLGPLVGGCPGQNGIPSGYIAVGQKPIVPSTQLQVGHLYFEGQGKRPVFALADGTIFSELCYADYGQTAALANIKKFITISDTPLYGDSTTTLGQTLSINVTGIKLGILSVSANGSYNPSDTLKTESARMVSLNADGADIIRKSIGSACKKEVAGMLTQGKRVILVADAVRADKGTLTSTSGFNVGGGATLGGSISAGSGSSAALTGPGGTGQGGTTRSVQTNFTLLYLSITDATFAL